MNKAGKYALFIALIIFCAIFGFVGGNGYFADLHDAELARTAPYEATAVVDDAVTYTDGESTEWYYIMFHYTDEEGGYHEGTTNTAYSYSEAYDLVFVIKEMQIKYNDNYEVVAADFKYSHDFGMYTAFFYIGVIGGLATLAYGVVIIMQGKKEKEIKKNGKQAVATFVNKTCNVYVNGSPRYRIIYKYVASEEGGEERTVKSKELFPLEDAVYYETQKQFDVKYSGKLAFIAEKPYSKPARTATPTQVNNVVAGDAACDEHNNCDFDTAATPTPIFANLGDHDADTKNLLCEHCAAHLSPRDKHCPNCGAKVNKK